MVLPEELEPRVAEALALLQSDIDAAAFNLKPKRREDAVFCMLAGKSLRLALAVCRLVSGGFYGEAFGLTPSVLESFFIAKYITNEPEERAKSYMEFGKAHTFNREQIREKFFPEEPRPSWYTPEFIDEVKKKFPNTHHWVPAYNMAMEVSRHPNDIDQVTGKGFQAITDYEGTYESASQYVHCTIVSTHRNFEGSPYATPRNDVELDKGILALHFSLAAARQVCSC